MDLLGRPLFTGPLRVRRIERYTADPWCARYHYSGNAGLGAASFYGAFAPDLVGVVGISPPTSSTLRGLASKLALGSWKGNLEINRVAVHPDAPPNAASCVVARVLTVLIAPKGIDWVYSYADPAQRHHGGIYQALNAVYVGLSAPGSGWMLNGVRTHPRTLINRYGTSTRPFVFEAAAAQGDELTYVSELATRKHTYVLPIARDRAVRRAIREHLAEYAKPYPKRAVAASSDAVDFHSTEGGPQPTLPLHSSTAA